MKTSRRTFLTQAALAVGVMSTGWRAWADPKGKPVRHQPVGLQLYTLGDAVVTDTANVMTQLARFGYEELEAIPYPKLPPETLRRRAEDAGLKLRSVHLDFSGSHDPAALFDSAHRLGVNQVVSSVLAPSADPGPAFDALTADDFKRIAARANHIGELAKGAGLSYGYHNHDFEFRKLAASATGYDILLKETDARYVHFEADCGWMSTAGANPVDYFKRYPGRYQSAHIKDFDGLGLGRKPRGRIVELGTGAIDYRPIVRALLDADVKHLFVEHDPPDGKPIPMDEVEREGRHLRHLLSAM